MNQTAMKDLFLTLPQSGRIDWIGLRPSRRAEICVVEEAEIDIEQGILGDRFAGKPGSKRMVTLIQSEHLTAVASLLGLESLDPRLLRRNIVVSGINLLALKAPDNELTFSIGQAVLKMTGACHPCSRMEEYLGPGGFNAMRGHGGITTSVIQGGKVKVGDMVQLLQAVTAEE